MFPDPAERADQRLLLFSNGHFEMFYHNRFRMICEGVFEFLFRSIVRHGVSYFALFALFSKVSELLVLFYVLNLRGESLFDVGSCWVAA